MNAKKLTKLVVVIAFLGATGVFYHYSTSTSEVGELITTKEEGKKLESPKATQVAATGVAVGENRELATPIPHKEKTRIVIYICGAVKKPGVYEFSENDRVVDAIKRAGGLTKQAAEQAVNQARTLCDGEQLYIPTKEEYIAGNYEEQNTSKDSRTDQNEDTNSIGQGKVNLNTATVEQLITLPGIGQAKASKIIDYRESNGKFVKIEDIMQIPGIKQGVFEKIKEQIYVQ